MAKKPEHNIALIAVSIVLAILGLVFLPFGLACVLIIALVFAYYSTIWEIFGPTGPK